MGLGERFDAVLVAAQAGGESAIAELFRDLYPRLLRYLRAMEPREGEDLASETWLDVAAGLGRFNGGEDAFRAWAFTIARRRLIDMRRRRTGRRTQPVPPEELLAHSGTGDAERDAMNEIGTREALALIAALPPDQAEVVLLRVLGGLDTDRVARIVGKRAGTVRVLQHRALRRLAQQVEREVVTE